MLVLGSASVFSVCLRDLWVQHFNLQIRLRHASTGNEVFKLTLPSLVRLIGKR